MAQARPYGALGVPAGGYQLAGAKLEQLVNALSAPPRRPSSALEVVCDRLAAWAYWIHSGRVFPQGYRLRSVETRLREELGATGGGARPSRIPNPECEQMEELVRYLPSELRAAIDARYVLRLGGEDARAKHCGTSIGEYHVRLRCARYCLYGMLQLV